MSDETADPVRWSRGGGPPGAADLVRAISRPSALPPALRTDVRGRLSRAVRPPAARWIAPTVLAAAVVVGGLVLWSRSPAPLPEVAIEPDAVSEALVETAPVPMRELEAPSEVVSEASPAPVVASVLTAEQRVAGRRVADYLARLLSARSADERDVLAREGVDEILDVGAIAEASLGDHWAELTPTQRTEVRVSLELLIENRMRDADMSAFALRDVVVGPGSDQEEVIVVVTAAPLSGEGGLVGITYVVRRVDDGWAAVDIITEGVSSVATYGRSFDRLIRDHGIDGLLERVRDRLEREDWDGEEPDRALEVAHDAAGTGTLFVNATPWARVYVDGEPVGTTPILRLELPAGAHEVRLDATEGGGIERTFSIEIVAGETVRVRRNLSGDDAAREAEAEARYSTLELDAPTTRLDRSCTTQRDCERLIDSLRATPGMESDVVRTMREYLRRFPSTPRARAFQQYLMTHGG